MTITARDPRAPFVLTPVAQSMQRRERKWDGVLLGSALVLSLLGSVLVWAATRDLQRAAGANPQAYLYRDLANVAIAAALTVLAARLDTRLLRLFGPAVYVLSVLGLALVFAIGSTVNGAHAWIRLGGGFEVQPAEFMKLGMIVGMAVLFTRREGERDTDSPTSADVLLAIGLVAVPLALIMLQPDLGSAMVLAAAAFGVLVAAGVRTRWILGLVLATVVVTVIVVKAGVLADYQLARISSFAHPSADVQGAGYNVAQAHIAIANGGLFGRGLFNGPQTNGGFVPEQQTDFVFSVAGEEFGLVGGFAIIVLIGLVCWRGLVIARDADRAGRLICVGVVCWLAFQTFQNIGMTLGLMPVTGLPLPFVSYGGSAMFAQGLAIGLMLAVRRRSPAR